MKIIDIFESNGPTVLDWRVGENLHVDGMSRQFKNLKMNPVKLVDVFGKPQAFTDRLSDVDYMWEIEIDYKDSSHHDPSDKDDFDTVIFNIYTVKYDPDNLPPLDEQREWNIGARNKMTDKMIILDFLKSKKLL